MSSQRRKKLTPKQLQPIDPADMRMAIRSMHEAVVDRLPKIPIAASLSVPKRIRNALMRQSLEIEYITPAELIGEEKHAISYHPEFPPLCEEVVFVGPPPRCGCYIDNSGIGFIVFSIRTSDRKPDEDMLLNLRRENPALEIWHSGDGTGHYRYDVMMFDIRVERLKQAMKEVERVVYRVLTEKEVQQDKHADTEVIMAKLESALRN